MACRNDSGFPMAQRIIIFFFVLLLAVPAHAQEYAKPDWTNLLRTLIRFNAITLDDPKILDEYAAVSECDLYKTLYSDDFKWNEARTAIRESVRMNVATFPASYSYTTQLQLDRYDFQNKIFRLTEKTSLKNVNTFRIYKVDGAPCDGMVTKYIPTTFRAVLDVPIFFGGIPLAPNDAEALLNHMKADKNIDRVITAQFNLRVVFIAPMHLSRISGDTRGYTQNGNDEERTSRLDVRLDSINFYEDTAMTKLIYRLQP